MGVDVVRRGQPGSPVRREHLPGASPYLSRGFLRPRHYGRSTHAIVLLASRSRVRTASIIWSSLVSSILLWLIPRKDWTNNITVGIPARATSAASCKGPDGIR